MDSAAKTDRDRRHGDAPGRRDDRDMLKSKPGAVRSILSDVEKLTATLDQQQRQVSASRHWRRVIPTGGPAKTLEEMIRRIRACCQS